MNKKYQIAQKVIRLAAENWGEGNLGFAFTGRKDSSVVMHLALEILSKPPRCLFIDHGLHFQQSYKHLERLTRLWNLDVHHRADDELLKKIQQEADIEKKAVLSRELKIKTIKNWIEKEKIKVLVTAIRWDESPARAWEKFFSKRDNHVRVHPILHLSEEEIWEYIKMKKIPYNPLYDQGYRSIGEKPFTKKSSQSERSGREQNKEEVMERLRSLGYF